MPRAADATWITAKIHTRPERMNDIIARHLPALLTELRNPCWWFVRYHRPRETDYLRLRLRITPDDYPASSKALGEWTRQMRQVVLTGRLVLDEDVFAADSRSVAAILSDLPSTAAHPTALAAAGMAAMAEGLLGGPAEAADWLVDRPARSTPTTDRLVTD